MATIKQIKKKLDKLEIEYLSDARKGELETLLTKSKETSTESAPSKPEETPDTLDHEDRPRNIKADAPEYIEPNDDFVDPNASPATQA